MVRGGQEETWRGKISGKTVVNYYVGRLSEIEQSVPRGCWFTKRKKKHRPINVIPAYQSEFISPENSVADNEATAGENRKSRRKTAKKRWLRNGTGSQGWRKQTRKTRRRDIGRKRRVVRGEGKGLQGRNAANACTTCQEKELVTLASLDTSKVI